MAKISGVSQWCAMYLLPGLAFKSVIVGGGYGTGREITEFFLSHGAFGGLVGMLVTALVWGLVLAVAFELARLTRSYNYKSLFQTLLGRYWWLFEVIYVLIAFLVLAVLGSASGEIVQQSFGIPPMWGGVLLMVLVGLLTFFGSKAIEKFFVCWSAVLFITYGTLLVLTLSNYQTQIVAQFQWAPLSGGEVVDGVRYAAYNLNALAAVLFVVPRFLTTKNAVGAGLIAGLIGIAPAVLLFLTLLAGYPQVTQSALPVVDIMLMQNLLWLLVLFKVMLFGTFIETGSGVLHAVNERIAGSFSAQKRPFPHWLRAAVPLSFLFCAIFLASEFGIIDLIAKGYGVLSYAYILVVILPLLLYGSIRIVRLRRQSAVAQA